MDPHPHPPDSPGATDVETDGGGYGGGAGKEGGLVKKPSEKQVQAGIKSFLRMMGYAVYDLSQPRRTMQTAGLPDLYVMGHGRALWVEVKAPGGKMSPHQQQFREEALEVGMEHHVWRSTKEAAEWYEEAREARHYRQGAG